MNQRKFAHAFLGLALVASVGLARPAAAADAVLIEFSSPSCGPCRAMQPVLQQLERSGVPVRHVNVETEPHLAERYGIRKTPTFVVVTAGREVSRLVGMQSARQLRAALATDPSGPHVPTDSRVAAPKQRGAPQTQLTRIEDAVGRATAAGATSHPSQTSNRGPSHAEAMPSRSVAEAVERARAATVRLRVHDGQGFGVGTGTVIDTHGDEALVLTCGHLFRETDGEGKIEVDLFVGGETKTVSGETVDFDAGDRDIGLVAIRPGFDVRPVAVVASNDGIQPGQAVFSYGCDRGADPTRQDTRITGIDKYNQHLDASNIEIAGAPVNGRSGGGLFDHQGRLIGVCNAADYEGDVGIYTGPRSVRWQLDRVQLSHLYRNPRTDPGQPAGGPESERLASRTDSPAPTPQLTPAAGGETPTPRSSTPTAAAPVGPASSAGPKTAGRGGRSAGREMIVIIRDRNDPAAGSSVLELDQPSDHLLEMIRRGARR